eukprot:1630976-Pyramimonas_sp.AAC.1
MICGCHMSVSSPTSRVRGPLTNLGTQQMPNACRGCGMGSGGSGFTHGGSGYYYRGRNPGYYCRRATRVRAHTQVHRRQSGIHLAALCNTVR